MKVLAVVGTRPEVIKLAPVIRELRRRADDGLQTVVCSTAQHRELVDQALDLFAIQADYDLAVMEPDQSLAGVASAVLARLEPVLARERPDWVLVQGDTTTVAAAAMAAYYAGARVGHVEAGLRTGDRRQPFPEEINRQLATVAADLHFAPTRRARENLLRENVPAAKIVVTGNPVIDALRWVADLPPADEGAALLASTGILLPTACAAAQGGRRLVLVTAHRRESFGAPLENVCAALREIASRYGDAVQIVYAVHPNPHVHDTVHRLLDDVPNVTLTPPLSYGALVHLMRHAYLVLTDSGGLQEEAPGLGVPVLVLRDVTERPEAVEVGSVALVGTGQADIVRETTRLLDDAAAHTRMARAVNPYGDGQASQRIVAALLGERVEPFRPHSAGRKSTRKRPGRAFKRHRLVRRARGALARGNALGGLPGSEMKDETAKPRSHPPSPETTSVWRTRPTLKVPLRLEERRLLLVAADLLVIILAALGSLYVWSVQRGSPFDMDFIAQQYRWFIVFGVLWIVASVATNFYDIRLAADLGSVWSSIFKTSVVALVGYLVIYWLSLPGSIPRNIAGYQAAFTFLGIACSRSLYRLLIGRSPFSRRVIVVGAGGAGQAIIETIQRYVKPHYDVVGFVDEDPEKVLPPGMPRILGTPRDLLDLAGKYKAMEIVLAVTYRLHEPTFRAVLDCQERGLQVTPMPVLYEEITGRVPVKHIGDNWYVALPLRPASSSGLYPIAKRSFDVAVALVGLALFAVVVLPLGLVIRFTSPGPIFFGQDRVGRGGRVFRMHKLRSMVAGAESDAPMWAADNDPRVTWIGRWMRRAHLDELPQMWSILRGDMSVVGPRPERPGFVAALEQDIPFYRLRHAVNPGITGWAQISFGYVDSADAARLRLEYDLYYIKRQSVWLDVLILARTLGHVMQFQGR